MSGSAGAAAWISGPINNPAGTVPGILVHNLLRDNDYQYARYDKRDKSGILGHGSAKNHRQYHCQATCEQNCLDAHLVLARDALDLAAELIQYARELLHRDFRASFADAGCS
jgi:hypothetical protein